MRKLLILAVAAATLGVSALLAQAAPFTLGPTSVASGVSPFAPGCGGPGEAVASSVVYQNAEVETHVAVNPNNPNNVVAYWQQDRWNDGGSRGLVTARTINGGETWQLNANTKSSICTGGTTANGGDYERASDPWVSIAPDGTTYLMSLSVDTNPGGFGLHPNAMLVMRSDDGGVTWDNPTTLKRDEGTGVLNDKNSMTADPLDAEFAYAVWDRLLVPPSEPAPATATENTIAGKGPTWFTRTTDGGDSWEPARVIFDPGARAQTIGNQIAVTGSGDLVNAFDLIHETAQPRGFSIAVIRSEDNGESWDKHATVVDRHDSFQGIVIDPDNPNTNTRRVRTGDILPEVATDLNSEAVYLVWQDARFGPRSSVAFSQSLDGGETWSPTVKINQTPTDISLGNQQAFTPMVRVSDDGTVTATYYDFRANETAPAITPLLTDAFAIHCHAAADDCTDPDSWTDEVPLTDASFDMTQAPFANGNFVGDYEGLETDGTDFFPFFSMPHGDDPASVFVRSVGP